MVKDLNFKQKMKAKAPKPDIVVKHTVSKAKSPNNAQLTVRISNQLNYDFEMLKASITYKTNKAFVANAFFVSILKDIENDFNKGIIEKNFKKFISIKGYRTVGHEENTHKNIRLPLQFKALLRQHVMKVSASVNEEISLTTIFTHYFEKALENLKKEYEI